MEHPLECRSHPSVIPLGEGGLKLTFKQSASVLEILFGVGFGGSDALKRFVEDTDDPQLFGERWDGHWKVENVILTESSLGRTIRNLQELALKFIRDEVVVEPRSIEHLQIRNPLHQRHIVCASLVSENLSDRSPIPAN